MKDRPSKYIDKAYKLAKIAKAVLSIVKNLFELFDRFK